MWWDSLATTQLLPGQNEISEIQNERRFDHGWNHHFIFTLNSCAFSDMLFCPGNTLPFKYHFVEVEYNGNPWSASIVLQDYRIKNKNVIFSSLKILNFIRTKYSAHDCQTCPRGMLNTQLLLLWPQQHMQWYDMNSNKMKWNAIKWNEMQRGAVLCKRCNAVRRSPMKPNEIRHYQMRWYATPMDVVWQQISRAFIAWDWTALLNVRHSRNSHQKRQRQRKRKESMKTDGHDMTWHDMTWLQSILHNTSLV